jgi:hypothetical protein
MRVSVIKARCIACGKRWEVSVNDKREAQAAGCVISPCCNFPSTVESVKVIEKSA